MRECKQCIHHDACDLNSRLSGNTNSLMYDGDCKLFKEHSEGEWKQTEEPMGWHDVDCVECSVCGESWVMNDNLDFDLIVEYWHYCPNCGAKMKGGAV